MGNVHSCLGRPPTLPALLGPGVFLAVPALPDSWLGVQAKGVGWGPAGGPEVGRAPPKTVSSLPRLACGSLLLRLCPWPLGTVISQCEAPTCCPLGIASRGRGER